MPYPDCVVVGSGDEQLVVLVCGDSCGKDLGIVCLPSAEALVSLADVSGGAS